MTSETEDGASDLATTADDGRSPLREEPLSFTAARDRFSEALERRLMASVSGDGVLFEAGRYHLETGGKRLRGLLPPWVAHNLTLVRPDRSRVVEDALVLGVALELIHNGTLVHDDVQDGDTLRRGRPTVWVRYGMPQAVNLGTTLLLLGVQQVVGARRGHEIIGDINLAILDIVAGQALEFELQTHDGPTTAMWERMAAGKTGALFSACFLGAVHAAGLPSADLREAARFGSRLGVFFQLQDDLLDLVGDKQRDVPATDIAEGKISWPVAWACERRSGPSAAAIERMLESVRAPRAATSLAMIHEALGLLHEVGAIRAGLDRVAQLGAELTAHPLSRSSPGLVERVLDPIRHAL
ncbi:MAG: polyprenyl synthetase family protein [Deltaproteobacteria bacterium]|nr:polyprenyl synthetase family protein [Deltaproteobacteria bacterium]